jgi:GntR family transcriptional regulator/MocR family aminotransferase
VKARYLLELPWSLDRSVSEPLARQIAHQIRTAIQQGSLAGGTPLPSSRELAEELSVSRGVVRSAYDLLAAAGYLDPRPQAVPRVHPLDSTDAAEEPDTPRPALFDFSAVAPDLALFPRRAWQRAIDYAISSAPDSAFDYAPPEGLLELRQELAAYLGRVRGVRAPAHRLVITQGFTQALEVVTRVLAARGAVRIGVENPSYSFHIAQRSGLERLAMAVDGHGAQVDELIAGNADAVLLTPAHQFPMGGVLDPARRQRVVTWARDTGAVVIEDDYTAEYRYDSLPITAMQGLAPEHVVYAGSLSKILAPGLRIGWMVVPEDMVEEVRREKAQQDLCSPGIDQLAYARFLQSGAMDEHLRRSRPIYARRRHRFIAEVKGTLPNVTVVGAATGLHVVALLRRPIDMDAFLLACAESRIAIKDLGSYSFAPHDHGQGLVLGYGRISEAAAGSALQRIATFLDACTLN